MPKPKEQKETVEETPYPYDRNKPQTVKMEIQKGGKTFPVNHVINPISDERFFELELEIEQITKRAKSLSSDLYKPKHQLWKEVAESVTGYGKSDEWREKMYQADAVQALNAVLHCEVVTETEETGKDEVLEFDALTPIRLRVLQSGVLTEKVHNYREETKAEMDEYLSIVTSAPNPNALASAEKMSGSEKLFRLGKKLLKNVEGYASDVPAWHIVASAQAFFEQQLARLGK
jgi:hypothetical protein